MSKPTLVKVLKQRSLLNLRDASRDCVHMLTVAKAPEWGCDEHKEWYETTWPALAAAMWKAQPIQGARGVGKRTLGESSTSDGKQAKLSFE